MGLLVGVALAGSGGGELGNSVGVGWFIELGSTGGRKFRYIPTAEDEQRTTTNTITIKIFEGTTLKRSCLKLFQQLIIGY